MFECGVIGLQGGRDDGVPCDDEVDDGGFCCFQFLLACAAQSSECEVCTVQCAHTVGGGSIFMKMYLYLENYTRNSKLHWGPKKLKKWLARPLEASRSPVTLVQLNRSSTGTLTVDGLASV